MKVNIIRDEWYPCYSVEHDEDKNRCGIKIEMSDVEYFDHLEMEREFIEWLRKLDKLYNSEMFKSRLLNE